MSALVYQAITGVMADLAEVGIPKTQRNEEDGYDYRGIEDVLRTLAPLLARHKLCVLPRVLERVAVRGRGGSQVVVLRVAFDFVSAIDGSLHTAESFGEALDDGDKGTAKAMSAAYKAAMLQAFCIPVPQEDADGASRQLNGSGDSGAVPLAEPPEGWEGWSNDVAYIAASCETADAVDLLLTKRRGQLSALQRSRPEIYARLGDAIATRLADLQAPKRDTIVASRDKKKRGDTSVERSTAAAA